MANQQLRWASGGKRWAARGQPGRVVHRRPRFVHTLARQRHVHGRLPQKNRAHPGGAPIYAFMYAAYPSRGCTLPSRGLVG
ncbi:Hypothetical protein H16_A2482 [Cupriavidus necator H16]|uniref:Uncharacterized protein n=1 Tax=Cupriavidus necator (strain ATCC 17699 / DSM 428 / KCTC 22496 / NCIMB 10442 / H16 / Stanier 337) TaxID=381666 RepID=Q0K8V1_CUPNH|nr:Hypothetical protein H16_A2482 [Cupriavidus necator H16]